MNVRRLAIAVRVAAGFCCFSNIHAVAHTMNEQTCYTEEQTAIKAALALLRHTVILPNHWLGLCARLHAC